MVRLGSPDLPSVLFNSPADLNLKDMSAELHSAEHVFRRVTELEMLFTHLQRTVQDLDKVILDQQKQIDGLRGELSRIMTTLDQFSELSVESRDERPPHY